MQLFLDIFYVLLVIACLFLVYRGCQQDMRGITNLHINYQVSNKKLNESKKNVSETHSTVLEGPPSYNDVVG